MKRLVSAAILAVASLAARAQGATTAAYSNFCQLGGQNVKTQGAASSTTVQASYPKCQVDVYLSGTSNRAPLFSDAIGTPLPNPFTAKTNGSFVFFAATGQAYDVVLSGGTPNAFPQPFVLADVLLGGGNGQGGGTIISGTPNVFPVFDSHGSNVTNSPLSVSTDGSTVSFQGTAPYGVMRVHGSQFGWLQLDNDSAPAGQKDARLIQRNNGHVQLEALSGDGANPSGYGEGVIFDFAPSSTANKFGGMLNVGVPMSVSQYIGITPSTPGNGQTTFVAGISDLDNGWDHGTSGTYSMTPMLTALSTTFNGFHGLWDFQYVNRSHAGDQQVFNVGLQDRGGGLEPSDEEEHLWRVEHQTVQPYFGLYQSTGASTTGHPQYAMLPQYNQYQLGPENPLVDISTRQTMNVTAVTTQTPNGGITSALVTTSDMHATSVSGIIQNDNDAGNQDISTPVTVTMRVSWSGPDPLHGNCAAWPDVYVGNGHSHSPEPIYPTATVNNGDGTWNVTAEILHSHFTNDHLSCFGTVGRYIDFADSDVSGTNGYYTVEYHELVIESPAANQERTAHPAFGGMDSYAHVSAAKRYQGVPVLDAMTASAGNTVVVQNSYFQPGAGDQLVQFNSMEQGYSMWLENEDLINPYMAYGVLLLNLQNSHLNASRSQVFNLALTPNLATFVYPTQAGPFVTQGFAPNTSAVGGNCVGHAYEICVSQTGPTDEYDIFRTQWASGGVFQLHVSGATKSVSTIGYGLDLGGVVSTFENGQVQGSGEFGVKYTNPGVPAIEAAAAFNGATVPQLLSRCGFANATSLTSVGGGGFVSQWHVSAALDAAVTNATFCQLEGSHYVIIGNDATDPNPLVDMNPVDGSMKLGHGQMIVPQSDNIAHHWKLQVSSTGAVSAIQVD